MSEPKFQPDLSRFEEASPATNVKLVHLASNLSAPAYPPIDEQNAGLALIPYSQARYEKSQARYEKRTDHSLFQFLVGGMVGSALTLPITGLVTTSEQSSVSTPPDSQEMQGTGGSSPRFTPSMFAQPLAEPSQPILNSSVAPSSPVQAQSTTPNLVVDRFYLANPSVKSSGGTMQPLMVVDRFYFPGSTVGVAPSMSPPETMAFVDRYYLPERSHPVEPSEQVNKPETPIVPISNIQLSNLALVNRPTHPTEDSSRAAGWQAATMPIQQQPQPDHMLLGTLETSALSAALFQTNNNTYSVRIGEMVGNSQWTLSSIQGQKVTLTRGNETITLNIGDIF